MEWSIQDIAKIAGTTSRALRHYDDIGLLKPSRTGSNGYRYYGQPALMQLQRILLLRELGLGLPVIAQVLQREADTIQALHGHLDWLEQEQERLARQIVSVRRTIEAVKGGEQLMAEEILDGFDHTRYKDEVEERWGKDAYAKGDSWWRAMRPEEKLAWKQRVQDLGRDWIAAAESGLAADSSEAQELAKRHVDWLRGVPGTPAAAASADGGGETGGGIKAYVIGLGEMYVADPRFGANYGGEQGARFVRDALRIYAEQNL
jgi:DNA-binding transcriptional MerR regulator